MTHSTDFKVLPASYYAFPLHPNQYAPAPVPSLPEWHQLWAAWDLVTRRMIPTEDLVSKPISLRNCLLFYLGHIPTFEDIHLTRACNGVPTEPSLYAEIFERGIDPDVDNPEICHDHSEPPNTWPPLEEILSYQQRVRERITAQYVKKTAETDRKVGQALWIGFEHEGLHLETFLYMLLQSDKVLSPPGSTPDFETLAHHASMQKIENQWFRVPASRVTLGLTDSENDEDPDRFYGWDNERPPRQVDVPAFEAQARALTNGDYAQYLVETNSNTCPVSWISEKPQTTGASQANGINHRQTLAVGEGGLDKMKAFLAGKGIRTVYGHIPLAYALEWPVMASYNELAGCAKWAGGRIPTLEEARSIYHFVEQQKAKRSRSSFVRSSPATSGDSVKKTYKPDPTNIFVDLSGCNVGLQHFHPLPVSQNGNRLSGLGDMGGAWEWTSSLLAPYEGFKPMDIYPGYTADFMDGKHNVVLGGSWATHPRITGRTSFLNWWQRNYLYPWVSARIVREPAVEGNRGEKSEIRLI